MSLNRLALRTAAVEAIIGDLTTFATIAGALVFDSKMDPLEHDSAETVLPCVIVYTDMDKSEGLDKGGGKTFTRRTVTLFIEAVIGTYMGQHLTPVQTDAELEALLDCFEWQIERALKDPFAPTSRRFQNLVRGYDGWQSAPARSAKDANRISMRQMTIECCINQDCLPSAMALAPGDVVTIPKAARYFDAPYLKPVEDLISTQPAFANLADALREARTGVPSRALPLLRRLGFKTDFIDPYDPNLVPPGQHHGPDGRIDLDFSVDLKG